MRKAMMIGAACLLSVLPGAWAIDSTNAVLGKAEETTSEVSALLNDAQARMDEGKWADAAVKYRAATNKSPQSATAAFGLGTALIELKQFDDALATLEPLVKRYPDNPILLNNIAWIHVKATGTKVYDVKTAIRLAQDALLRAPDSHSIWGTLAEAYYADKQFGRAFSSARIALRTAQDAGAARLQDFQELYDRCDKARDASKLIE